jgi:hypothetical protein
MRGIIRQSFRKKNKIDYVDVPNPEHHLAIVKLPYDSTCSIPSL